MESSNRNLIVLSAVLGFIILLLLGLGAFMFYKYNLSDNERRSPCIEMNDDKKDDVSNDNAQDNDAPSTTKEDKNNEPDREEPKYKTVDEVLSSTGGYDRRVIAGMVPDGAVVKVSDAAPASLTISNTNFKLEFISYPEGYEDSLAKYELVEVTDGLEFMNMYRGKLSTDKRWTYMEDLTFADECSVMDQMVDGPCGKGYLDNSTTFIHAYCDTGAGVSICDNIIRNTRISIVRD